MKNHEKTESGKFIEKPMFFHWFFTFFDVLGTCFLMKIVKNIASEDKIACFFEKLAKEKGKEAEKTAQSLPKPRLKHPKGSQRARCGT